MPEEKKPEEKPTEFTTAQLAAAIRHIYGQMGEQNKAIMSKLEALESKSSKEPEPEREEETKPLDLETMSRKELVDFIVSSVQSRIVGPLAKRFEEDSATARDRELRQEVAELEKKHDDFWEFQDEMRTVMERRPGISLSEAYAIAKHETPDKVVMLDQKREAAQKEEAERKAKEAEAEKPPYGGLFPTSGKVVADDKMTLKDASEKAWEALDMDAALTAAGRSDVA